MKHKLLLLVTSLILIGAVVALGRVLWLNMPVRGDEPQPNVTVHVFDVGQGDSIFVEFADGTQLLVDGGVDDTVLSRLGEVMLPWDRHIDYVVATHPHADHVTGLIHVLDRFDVGHIIATGVPYDSSVYDAFNDAVLDEGAIVLSPDQFLLDQVEVIYPSDIVELVTGENVNETSIVLEINDGSHAFLLTGDIGEIVEEQLIAADVLDDIDVLKVGHQGSKFSSTRPFLEEIRPEHAVISVGEGNDYHHPHPSALKRLMDTGANIYRTDEDGTVTVRSYNDELVVSTGREHWTRRLFGAILSAN